MLTANLKFINKKLPVFFSFFAMFYIKNRITSESHSQSKYLRAPFAKNRHAQLRAD
jgi:DNA-directed RNA polymerase sigma subunit (sigma70/sigma32)